MTDRPQRPRDANQLAKLSLDLATGEALDKPPKAEGRRKGGLKGGAARAAALTPEQRSKIAQAATAARCKKSD